MPKTTLFESIHHGDKVSILVYAGRSSAGLEWKPKTGRAVMRGTVGWILDMGGRYGTSGIATEENTVRVVKGR
jgi:hypothetical protein